MFYFFHSIEVTEKSDKEIVITSGLNKAIIQVSPFGIDFYQNNVLTVSANAKGLMRFEHLRLKNKSNYNADGELIEEAENTNTKSKSIEVSFHWPNKLSLILNLQINMLFYFRMMILVPGKKISNPTTIQNQMVLKQLH